MDSRSVSLLQSLYISMAQTLALQQPSSLGYAASPPRIAVSEDGRQATRARYRCVFGITPCSALLIRLGHGLYQVEDVPNSRVG